MHSKQVPAEVRQGKPNVPLLCLAFVGVLILPAFAVRGRGALRNDIPQELKKVNLSVEDGRPLAKAIETLQAKYGWVITYEDPLYVHFSEIADVTEMVRNPLHKSRPGQATRVLVPKGGALVIEYDVMPDTGLPVDREAILRKLLETNSANGNPGRFRLEKTGEVLHVISTASKSTAGTFAPQESVLDAVITLPAEERSGLQTLEAICAAVRQATQTPVVVGTIPLNLFLQHRDQQGAASEKARDVLLNTLKRTGMNLSWRLLYGPGTKMYVLNIRQVPPPSSYAAKENSN